MQSRPCWLFGLGNDVRITLEGGRIARIDAGAQVQNGGIPV